MTMAERTVLVTGASTGIGFCVAQGLKARGYRVFGTARKKKDVERLCQEGIEATSMDLTDSSSIQSAVKTVLERTGGQLFAVVNNAAYGQPGAVEDLSREILREQFEVNLFGTHELTRLILPVMRRQGHGRVIQMSSLLGFVALKYRGAYNASKYALEGLSDTLRLELRGTGIDVVLIEPGPITSRFRATAFDAYARNIDREHSPHRAHYAEVEKYFQAEGQATRFTLPPEAVLAKVLDALESPRPKVRYRVTFPAYLFAFLKRVLPDRLFDEVLARV
jgi:NAD(P)-dependent dehydrogenase (short-subunit alcohol dehydrogenase family)